MTDDFDADGLADALIASDREDPPGSRDYPTEAMAIAAAAAVEARGVAVFRSGTFVEIA